MEGTARGSSMDHLVHKGVRILHVDHTAVQELPDTETTRAFFEQALKEIESQPKGSVLLLTSMSLHTRYDAEVVALQREFARANTPYVKKSAVVGASPLAKAIMATLRFVTGRDIRSFETTSEALDWLVE